MPVAHGLDPTVFPQFARLTANLAGMEGLLYGGFDALVNGVIRMVHMDTQPAKLLFHLQYFKLASTFPCSNLATNGSKSEWCKSHEANDFGCRTQENSSSTACALGKAEAGTETKANDLSSRPQENRSSAEETVGAGEGGAEEGGVENSTQEYGPLLPWRAFLVDEELWGMEAR